MKEIINFDDFVKVDITVGQILSAEKIENADKLLLLKVDMGTKDGGEKDLRQIVSGIATYFKNPEALVGVKCMFVANLEARTIRGYESQGMILAVSSPEGEFSLLCPSPSIIAGTRAK